MRVSINVADKQEAARLKFALDDPEVRAFVNVMGALLPLSPGGRRRAMTWVKDKLSEGDGPGFADPLQTVPGKSVLVEKS